MKNIKLKHIQIILVSIFMLYGCSLIESPKTFINPDEFFDGYDSYEAATIGIYSSLPSMYSERPLMLLEMFSDIYREPDASVEQALPTYQNEVSPIFYNVRYLWRYSYEIIKNVNFLIDKMPDTQEYESLAAEARFLRAFAYFHLVQAYGDVPLRKTPIKSYDDIQIERTSQEDIYDFIIDDLIFAETNLKDKAPQEGRVYKLVATSYLSKVYLTMAGNPLNKGKESYTKALDKALLVINSGRFKLLDDYQDVFHKTLYTNESIWERIVDPQIGGNPMTGITLTADGFKPTLLPAQWFIESFSQGDKRNEWGISKNYETPSGKILPSYFQKYVDNSIIDKNIAPGSVINNYSKSYIRLAELYLIAAESENEINGPNDAYQYINKIRWRARVDKSDLSQVPDLKGLTKEQFRDSVLLERKKELHLEGSTWFDLKRTNTLHRIQIIRPKSLVNPIGIYNQTWPIPDEELMSNKIEQNPMP